MMSLKMQYTKFSMALAFAAFSIGVAIGQTPAWPGSTPPSEATGTPAGSYALSDLETLDLYSGKVNFVVPLRDVTGRGSAAFRMSLPVQRGWIVSTITDPTLEYLVQTQETPDEIFNSLIDIQVGPYTPGAMMVKYPNSSSLYSCPDLHTSVPALTLTKLFFVGADGTETEFLDQQSGGQPLAGPPLCTSPLQGASRGTVFVSVDGSAMTFISSTTIYDTQGMADSTATGTLLFADGRRYIIAGGAVTDIFDIKGNHIGVTNGGPGTVSTWTDPLGRTTTITPANIGNNPVEDVINWKGANGSSRTITVIYQYLNSTGMLIQEESAGFVNGQSMQTYECLFPEATGTPIGNFNPWVIASIQLPNNQQYSFQYNSYGDLAKVTLPTGGAIEYDFPTFSGSNCPTTENDPVSGLSLGSLTVQRRLQQRRVYADGSTLAEVTNYSYATNSPQAGETTVTVMHKDPTGNVLSQEQHQFLGNPTALAPHDPTTNTSWQESREIETDLQNSSGTTLHKIVNVWQQRACNAFPADLNCWFVNDASYAYPTIQSPSDPNAPVHYPSLASKTSSLIDATPNQISEVTYDSYDEYLNPTSVTEYDYGSGGVGAKIRNTQTTYLLSGYDTVNSASVVSTIHVRRAPTDKKIYNGSGTYVAETQYAYDQTALTIETGTISGYVAPPSSQTSACSGGTTGNCLANLTTASQWSSSLGQFLPTKNTYDNLGNALSVTDPMTDQTSYSYTDSFSGNPTLSGATYAFPTTLTNALAQQTTYQYDYYLGRPTKSVDPNSITATAAYADPLDRPSQVTRGNNSAQTTLIYSDTPNAISVTTESDQSSLNDIVIKSEVLYDGLFRKQETRQFADCGYITVQQTYDAVGRPYTTTNPFRPCASESVQNTTTTYDALNRPSMITSPDGSVSNFVYVTNASTITDPCGISHTNTTDAAGRLTQVVEGRNAPTTAVCLNDATQPSSLTTTYAYDALDNLNKVTQGTQTRTFTYDSLSRLYQATNPESGAVTYSSYDKNGNLLTKTDARSVSTTMTYDGLDRVTSKAYSVVSGYTTPSVTYCYDGNTQGVCGTLGAPASNSSNNLVGHLTLLYSSASSISYPQYNVFGNVTQSSQTTNSQSFSLSYTYNLASALSSEMYPSGRIVSTCYDTANRPAAVVSGSVSPANTCGAAGYISGVQYASHGAIGQMTFGNGITEATSFNNRLQPIQISAGILTLNYSYPSGTNNGDMSKQTITWTGLPNPINQFYQYDQFNHLHLASENPSNQSSPVCLDPASSWCQQYGFDNFANRSISAQSNLGTSLVAPTAFNTATNRNNGTGWSYDNAGNILTDPSGATYQYDAENRQISTGSSTYAYDGDGRRVSRIVAGVQSVYAYDAFGNLVAEYGSTNSVSGTVYLTADHLGSTRLVTSSANTLVNGTSPGAAGTAIECRDYLPFGEQILVSSGSPRSGLPCLTTEIGVRQQFTSKERDAETGLDYFGARYFSSAQGRFTSADPKQFSSRTLMNPQKWNKYAYTLNNPLALVDPEGKEEVTIQFRALIPPSSIAGFRGDNRSFSADPNASSRVSTTARIETDPAKNGGNPLLGFSTVVGGTQPMIGGDPRVSDGPIQPVVTATQDKDGNVIVNIQESMGNPFTHGVDPSGTIKSNMNIVVNESATNAQFKGTVSGSPAFEANISVNGGTNQNVPLQAAPTNTLQFVLGLHSTDQINKTVPLKKDPSQQ